MMPPPPLGAILAGGRNTRFGAPKALATVGGERIIDRLTRALGAVTPDIVLITNEAEVYASVGLTMRPDARPGLGALGGIYSALLWAREERRPGALVVACDMPFVDDRLLARLAAGAGGEADVVAPESGGRRGIEPLCAYYSVRCIPAIETRIERGDLRVVGFYDDVAVERVPLDEVRGFGDPRTLFLNVNTPEERERAEALARG
jgi:molybdopterin-guanine dinucleotide biosynthesis protein A